MKEYDELIRASRELLDYCGDWKNGQSQTRQGEILRRLERATGRARVVRHLEEHWHKHGLDRMRDGELRELLAQMSGQEREALLGADLRHMQYAEPQDFLEHFLTICRPFGFATRDDSWGELEKILTIILSNHAVWFERARTEREDEEARKRMEESARANGGVPTSVTGDVID